MQALTVTPGTGSPPRLRDLAEPAPEQGPVLVESLAVGLCGTDREIVEGRYGQAPPGQDHLVLGHENLGRVRQTPQASGLSEGDLVVGIVRRPDPVPCKACAAGEWDMCRNGLYTEHGIKGLDGFARGFWRGAPEDMVRLDAGLAEVGVLLEPATIVAKAWEQIGRISQRAFFDPHLVVVTGAGPIGLLATLLGVQRGLEVHVFDIVTDGLKPELVRSLGAIYHSRPLPETGVKADILIECTGVPDVVLDVLSCRALDAITCLTGVSGTGQEVEVDVGAHNRRTVLRNEVVFGSVNANRRHYSAAARALGAADRNWLQRLITRRLPLADFVGAFSPRPDDIKVVLDLESRSDGDPRLRP